MLHQRPMRTAAPSALITQYGQKLLPSPALTRPKIRAVGSTNAGRSSFTSGPNSNFMDEPRCLVGCEPDGLPAGGPWCMNEAFRPAQEIGTVARQYGIGSVPADGIGPEVVRAGLEVLDAVASRDGGFSLMVDHYDWGSNWYRKHGVFMPPDGLAWLRTADAIYFGAVGDPNIPDHVSLWGLRLQICQGLDQYANVRPTRILAGVTSPLRNVAPGDLDWVIVRENSEGEYSGHGGRVHRGLPEEVATETAIFTRRGVERIMRVAFDIARSRPRKHLTVVTKSNAQRHGMVFWDEIAGLVSHDYKDVTWDKELVDAMTMRMVLRPQTIDTVVATNLHADILSDLAAALAGSLGIAPTANLDPERRSPSMFEPIHGSAFDLPGHRNPHP